jgi:hypothetical protein
MLLADEGTLRICYYVEEDRLSEAWLQLKVHPAAPDDSNDLCAVVTFALASAHMFGPLNDEAFSGHPLASRGLQPYRAFEVEHSSWLRTLE